MKNIKNLVFTTLLTVVFFSCSKDNDEINLEEITNNNKNTPNEEIIFDPEDSPTYYDQDENCDLSASGNCCDVDGRLKVRPNFCYKYTYVGKNSNQPNFSMEWEVISGSITIVQGQNTGEVTIKIGSDFTGGIIKGKGIANGDKCDDTFYLSKLE